MTSHAILDLVACAGQLAVGNLVLLRRTGSPLAVPLGVLAFDMFAWNFADFAFSVSGAPHWHLLDLGLSPFSPALALHLVATFVGASRARRVTLFTSYTFFGGLAASAWLAFGWRPAAAWTSSSTYSGIFLVGQIAVMICSLALLASHLRHTRDLAERMRTKTMVASVIVGAALATTDFWDDFGFAVPSLANIGTMVSVLLMAIASLRLRLLGKNLTARLAVVALGLASLGVASYLAVFRWLSDNDAIMMVATVTVTVTLTAALRQVAKRFFAHRDRMEGLATMGRFSAQMAHDLKNPLGALKGALQFLGEEAARGRSLATQGEFINLVVQQVDRIDRVVDDYQRLGHVSPRLSPVDVNETVREVLALEPFAARGITVETELEEGLPLSSLDRDLVGRAVENLVRNGAEAMPQGGTLTVRTGRAGRSWLTIAVSDTGIGMDARQSERAFDEFFTTKAQGSGLGLAFVRRVVRAHAGRVHIKSEIGRGTTVSLRFPGRRA